MEMAKETGKKAKEAKEAVKKKRSKRDEDTEDDGSDDELSGLAEGDGHEDDEVETSDSETGGSLRETLRINDELDEKTKRLVQKKKDEEGGRNDCRCGQKTCKEDARACTQAQCLS